MKAEQFLKLIRNTDNNAIVKIKPVEGSCHSTIDATEINPDFHRIRDDSDEPVVSIFSSYFYNGNKLTAFDLACVINLNSEYNNREIVIDG